MKVNPTLLAVVGLAVTTALVTFSLAVFPASAAGPWFVQSGGSDSDNCLSPSTACATINGAIGKASPGDTIFVAVGTYTGSGSEVVLISKSISLSGGWDIGFSSQNGTSTIDGENARRALTAITGVTASVDKFHFLSGFAPPCQLGSGVFNEGTLTLTDSIVSESTECGGGAVANKGILTMEDSEVIRNSVGGIDNQGTMTISNTLISENTGGQGGGIRNLGVLTINNSAIRLNAVSGDGGGILNVGTLTLNNSAVNRNKAAVRGGGISSREGGSSLTLNNSTISANNVIWGGRGGGIYSGNSVLRLNSSTVSGNMAMNGGGIFRDGGAGEVTLQNTILANNIGLLGTDPDCGIFGGSGTEFSSAGYNLIGDTTGCPFTPGTGDLTNVGADLGKLIGLQNSPRYLPLLSSSPAIDGGNPAGCTDGVGDPLSTDQRGATRAGRCDIGAYEYVVPGSAAVVSVINGTPQRTPPSFKYERPLQVAVMDGIGSPVNSASVTFTAPASGASGRFEDSGTNSSNTLTDESGVATPATFTANGVPGSFEMTATTEGVPTSADFQLGNIAWYVSPSGVDANDCQSPATSCASVNGALGKTDFASGDAVLVRSGTFTGTGDGAVVILERNLRHVRLLGGWDASFNTQSSTSTIDGEGSRRGILVSCCVAVDMERFVIQNGISFRGGGIFNGGSLTLSNSGIRNNTTDLEAQSFGGGIYNNGTLTLNNSVVSNNASLFGGGIYNSSGIMTLNSTSVIGNKGRGGGIEDFEGVLTLNNSTVSGNDGVGIYTSGIVSVNSSTVSDNAGGGINKHGRDDLGFRLFMRNSILADNPFDGNFSDRDCYGLIESQGHNLIGDTADCSFTPTTGDLTDVEASLGLLVGNPGYHPLLESSPAIDAGNPGGCTDNEGNTLTTDQRGSSRVGRCDIGAYEYTVPGSPASIWAWGGTPQRTAPHSSFEGSVATAVLDSVGSPVENASVTFTAPASGATGTFADTGTSTTTATTGVSGVATAASFTANGDMGEYVVSATTAGVAGTADFLMNNIGWYISPGGDDGNDCLTPATSCGSIDGVLSKADFQPSDTALVATGTIIGGGPRVVVLDKSVRLLGGWNSTFNEQVGTTTIDGQGLRGGMQLHKSVDAIVDHFVIQNGVAGAGGGIYNNGDLTLSFSLVSNNSVLGNGGGILNLLGKVMIRNSIVSGNAARDGGGVSNDRGPLVVTNSSIVDNTARSGGGIYNGSISTASIVNSTISSNIADEDGGGIFNWGQVSLSSSTIANNSADGDGNGTGNGGGIALGTTFLRNTIIAGNKDSGGQAPDCKGTLNSEGYNLIQSAIGCGIVGDSTGDQIGVNPNLSPLQDNGGPSDTHALLPGSPAIDSGNPAGCTDQFGAPLIADQRGMSRTFDGDGDGNAICDVGAFEAQEFIPEPEPTFIDVPPDHWAYPFIEAIATAGLTAGFPDGTYRPDNPVTRGEMAVFLKKGIHGGSYSPPTPDGSHPFSDISGHWAEAWIEDLFDEGFTSGFPDGTYRPQNQVTRAEMAVFLKKAIHGSAYTSPTPDGSHPFSDIAGHWAEAWIEDLFDEGITSGFPDGTYRPENQVTRAEMAVFLVNAFNLPLP